MDIGQLQNTAIQILMSLLNIPSLSKQEDDAATFLENFFRKEAIAFSRTGNNIIVRNLCFDENKPIILLNSHIDTVKPGKNWTFPPFNATEVKDKIYGLGSNDAGASLVSLLAAFLYFYSKPNLSYNLVFAATAEEEISGANGIASILSHIGKIDLAIVGEPTQMQMAIAEKGLLVIDCVAKGKTGHAARNEGENAIYIALKDIQKIESGMFDKKSDILDEVKATVTIIEGGFQHNVVPDKCKFTIDVRTNELYSNQEALDIIQSSLRSECKARSLRLNSSRIETGHPIVKRGEELGLTTFGSPTLSDQALMPFTSIKIGPGNSARSHTENEYIYKQEIKDGITTYIDLLDGLRI